MKTHQFIILSSLLMLVVLALSFLAYLHRFSYISAGDDTVKHDRFTDTYYVLGISETHRLYNKGSIDKLTRHYDESLQFYKLDSFGAKY